jgi:hypothetical protein
MSGYVRVCLVWDKWEKPQKAAIGYRLVTLLPFTAILVSLDTNLGLKAATGTLK